MHDTLWKGLCTRLKGVKGIKLHHQIFILAEGESFCVHKKFWHENSVQIMAC